VISKVPHFRIPLNIPHAARVALRVEYWVRRGVQDPAGWEAVRELIGVLGPYKEAEDNPPAEEAQKVVDEAARLARLVVDDIEKFHAGHDRLGQAVRNLFECLALGEEGVHISLRAGENPDSALRPR
jgi:hypothetical protein